MKIKVVSILAEWKRSLALIGLIWIRKMILSDEFDEDESDEFYFCIYSLELRS